jgi:hypothetical protein
MLSRKITITLNCCHFSWLLLCLGLILMFRESFGPWHGHHFGWTGLAFTLVGKHMLNRVMMVQLEHEVEDLGQREVDTLNAVRRADLVPVK